MRDIFAGHVRCVGIAARLIIAALIIAFLYVGRPVLMPLAMSVVLAFALHPVVRRLMKWRLPRGLSVALTIGAFLLVITGLSFFIGGQVVSFAQDLPRYRENMREKVQDTRAWFSGGLLDTLRNTFTEVVGTPAASPATVTPAVSAEPSPLSLSKWLESAGMVTDPLTTCGLVILLAGMILLQWSDLRGRLLTMVSRNVTHTTSALSEAGKRVGRYLFLQLCYNACFGLVVGIALACLGVPYAALWGLCGALFRYLPYVGPVFATLLPLAVSLVTSSGWTQVIGVGAVFLILEVVSNNLIEPWLYGSKIGVSEIGIILASVSWAYLWGPVGLLLATPLTVCLVVVGEHVRGLSFVSRMLGAHATLTEAQSLYQRMLAGDLLEASQLTRKHTSDKGLDSYVSEMLLPALAQARHDDVAGQLDEETKRELLTDIRDLCESVLDCADIDSLTASSDSKAPQIVLWSVCPFTDTALPLIACSLQLPNDRVSLVKSTDLVGDVTQRLGALDISPAAVSIIHVSDVDTPRVTGLLKRLARALPQTHVQVVRFDRERQTASADAKSRMAAALGAVDLSLDMREARAWIQTYSALAPTQ